MYEEKTFDDYWEEYFKKDFANAKLQVQNITIDKGFPFPDEYRMYYVFYTKPELKKNINKIKKTSLFDLYYKPLTLAGPRNALDYIITNRKDIEKGLIDTNEIKMLEGKKLIAYLLHCIFRDANHYGYDTFFEYSIGRYCMENKIYCHWNYMSKALPRLCYDASKSWKGFCRSWSEMEFIEECKKRLKDYLKTLIILELCEGEHENEDYKYYIEHFAPKHCALVVYQNTERRKV